MAAIQLGKPLGARVIAAAGTPEKHVAAGRLAPHLDATFMFAQAGDALRRLEGRAVRGKLALVP